MPSLKDLRTRIASVKATQKITKAMQMVAAAKLRRAQEAAEQARPYAERMEEVIARLSKLLEGRTGAPALVMGTGRDEKHLLIVTTADRGLCGGFNSSIVKLAREHATALMAKGKQVQFMCLGQKGYDSLKYQFKDQILDTRRLGGSKGENFTLARQVGIQLLEMLDGESFDVCTLFYSEFRSIISQIPTTQQLIPVVLPEADDESIRPRAGQAIYEYEPDEDEILNELLPRNIRVQILRAMLENGASEQGARMSAMDSATRNAGEMIDKLTLQYNRARQAIITKELIEIISGAEAV